jgi:hypothetical protein
MFTVIYPKNGEIVASTPFQTKQEALDYIKNKHDDEFDLTEQKVYILHNNTLTLITPSDINIPHKWFCEVCDSNVVVSDKPDSGKFYRVYGRKSDADDWHSIVLAVCNECDPKNALQVVDPQYITRT